MLATCVLFHHVREGNPQFVGVFEKYEATVREFFRNFHTKNLWCAYRTLDGSRGCKQTAAGHRTKDHRDLEGIIGVGDFESPWDQSTELVWMTELGHDFRLLEKELQSQILRTWGDCYRTALATHHRELVNFHMVFKPEICHTTCFCCLMAFAEHIVACGHMFCLRCIRAYGEEKETSLQISFCPLGCGKANGDDTQPARLIPSSAGLRLLALEGGGRRTLLQLETLHRIEKLLGGRICIGAFFDLVVGAGAGAIAAVAISRTGAVAQDAIQAFTEVWNEARPADVPYIVARIISRSSSQTDRLHKALRSTFGHDRPFLDSRPQFRPDLRAAVTCTGPSGRNLVVIANYRRREVENSKHLFERAIAPDNEIKTWEALAASMAHPPHYKQFRHQNSAYLDGGFGEHPMMTAVAEARAIWGSEHPVDIVLSVGTGLDSERIVREGQKQKRSEARTEPRLKTKLRVGERHAYRTEKNWHFSLTEFRKRLQDDGRIVHCNPTFPETAPDAWRGGIDDLRLHISSILSLPHMEMLLQDIVSRLVASIFYYDWRSDRIECRFQPNSENIQHLGEFLLSCHCDDFSPHFSIVASSLHTRRTITREMCDEMRSRGSFDCVLRVTKRCKSNVTEIRLSLRKDPYNKSSSPLISGMQGPLSTGDKDAAAPNKGYERDPPLTTHQYVRPKDENHPAIRASSSAPKSSTLNQSDKDRLSLIEESITLEDGSSREQPEICVRKSAETVVIHLDTASRG